ncbi:MAG: enoyl-CoA hydratase/isomerase family protein [Planctomycetes bacterium]|nr:enoyl-CoA hydratase/isomerase family protein [Planctomycetota bacterium]
MSEPRVRFEVEGLVATITIDRPQALNALDPATISELSAAMDQLEASSATGAILTGGGKAFVAGADLKVLSDVQTADRARGYARQGQAVFGKISASSKPVIACVNGYALGGGLELALACHFRYASERAKLGLPEVTLGLIPGYGGTQRLSRLVGRGIATELILTGERINAAEALRIGLVNQVFADKDAMLAAAAATLQTIGAHGQVAVKLALEALERGLDGSLEHGLEVEADLFGIACSTKDAAEGIQAFIEKRPAEFQGK